MENQIYSILDQIFDQKFEIVQMITEPTYKWSGHSRCDDMEFLFSKDKEIMVMRSVDFPSDLIKPDYQLSLARWLRNEVPAGSPWTENTQTLHHVTVAVGKHRVELVIILSKRIEIALAA